MSSHPVAAVDLSALRELTQMLAALCASAELLPEGAERKAAIQIIGQYQKQVAALIRRHAS